MATSSIVEDSAAPNDAPTQDIRTYTVPDSTLQLLLSKVNQMETAFVELTAANAAKEDPRNERQNPEDIQEIISLHPTDSVDDEGDNTHSNVELESCNQRQSQSVICITLGLSQVWISTHCFPLRQRLIPAKA